MKRTTSLLAIVAMATSFAATQSALADMHIMKEHQPHPGISERDARQLGICYLHFDSIVSDNKPYVESSPLNPAYSFARSDAGWVGARAGNSALYMDSNNPLHPSFKR